MRLKWQEGRYATGMSVVDAQHKEIVEHIGELLDVTDREGWKTELADRLDFLTGYVTEHLRYEEEMMEARGHPERDALKEEHERFMEQLRAIQSRFGQDGNPQTVREEMDGMARRWLEEHVVGVDARLSAEVVR